MIPLVNDAQPILRKTHRVARIDIRLDRSSCERESCEPCSVWRRRLPACRPPNPLRDRQKQPDDRPRQALRCCEARPWSIGNEIRQRDPQWASGHASGCPGIVAAVCARLARRRRKMTPCRAVFVSWLTVTLRRDSSSATLSAESSFNVYQSDAGPSGSVEQLKSTFDGQWILFAQLRQHRRAVPHRCWINVPKPSSAVTRLSMRPAAGPRCVEQPLQARLLSRALEGQR